MNFLIFLFSTLCFDILLNGIFIAMPSHRVHIKSFRPKLTSPKLRLNFWMKFKNLLGRDTFYSLNYSRRAQHWNTLNQKMDMIVICSYFYKNDFKPFGYFKTNIFQTIINLFCKYNSTILGWTNKMIQQYRYIMTFMYKFAHKANLKLISKQSFGELTPQRLEDFIFYPYLMPMAYLEKTN